MLNEQDKQAIRELLREVLGARRLMTSEQVAKYLGVTLTTWRRLVSSRPGLKRVAVPVGKRGDISQVVDILRDRKARPASEQR